jgi:hypothetical protein
MVHGYLVPCQLVGLSDAVLLFHLTKEGFIVPELGLRRHTLNTDTHARKQLAAALLDCLSVEGKTYPAVWMNRWEQLDDYNRSDKQDEEEWKEILYFFHGCSLLTTVDRQGFFSLKHG